MTAKSVLMHPQGLRPGECNSTCPPCYATVGWVRAELGKSSGRIRAQMRSSQVNMVIGHLFSFSNS